MMQPPPPPHAQPHHHHGGAAALDDGVVDISWRWSSPHASMKATQAGIAAASVDLDDPSGIVLWGAVRGKTTFNALTSGKLAARCYVRNQSVPISAVHTLFEGFSMPWFYEQRFGRTHAESVELKRSRQIEWTFATVRMRCAGLPPNLLPLEGKLVTVRPDDDSWEVAGIPILSPSFPLASVRDGGGGGGGSSSLIEASDEQAEGGAGADDLSKPSITVCVAYVHSRGYTTRHVTDFVAWYLLLGARRIIIFDSLEADRVSHMGSEVPAQVRENIEGMRSLASALSPRVVLARGLCTHDTMQRATLNANCQVLASNLALQAVRAADVKSPSAYIIFADFDEYLVPPVGVAAGCVAEMGSSPLPPPERQPRLRGSLSRMAARVAAGGTVTCSALSSKRVDRPRARAAKRTAEPPPGVSASPALAAGRSSSGACIKFANVYHLPPLCNSHQASPGPSASAGRVDVKQRGGGGDIATPPPLNAASLAASLPAVLRVSRGFRPDVSEPGPSHTWGALSRWNWRVRSKYMMDARVPTAVAGIHSCCHTLGQMGHPPPENGCAMIDHVPREEWHMRHLRGPGKLDLFEAPCRRQALNVTECHPPTARASTDGSSSSNNSTDPACAIAEFFTAAGAQKAKHGSKGRGGRPLFYVPREMTLVEGDDGTFPDAWAAEMHAAVSRVSQAVVRNARRTQRGRSGPSGWKWKGERKN